MREKMPFSRSYSVKGKAKSLSETIFVLICLLFMIVLTDGCTKSVSYDPSIGDPLKAAIISVVPADKSGGAFVDPVVAVNFKDDVDPAVVTSAAITLKKGTTAVSGTVTIAGSTASFATETDLEPECEYIATVLTSPKNKTDLSLTHEYSWRFTTGKHHRIDSLSVVSVSPTDKTTGVPVTTPVLITFNQELSSAMKSAISITLKKGTSVVSSTIVFSGNTATLQPSASLLAGSVYTGNVIIGAMHATDDKSGNSFSWSFTTAGVAADVTAPVVSSVVPANATTTVSTTSKVSATFSEAMNAATINSTSFTLKKGSTAVAGTVAYSGSTASFTPSAALTASTVYTATITTAVKDAAGNPMAANYTWNFTTATVADVTPPTVLSSVPVSGATSISAGSKVSATFSETMDATTITSSSFTLKQGTTAITGTVAFTGTTATFSPAAALSGNTVYTATVTTGAKDVSGNQLAANYTWSFTTAVSTDVTPPAIISTTPANSGTSVAVTSNATAVFSEPMNAGMMTTSTFTMKQGTTAVAGTVGYSGTTATFTPSAALLAGTVYTCTVTTGVKDMAGNAMASNYTWSFTTAAMAPAGKSFATDVMPILNICNTCHTHPWTPSTNASTFYSNLLSAGYVNATAPTSGKIYVKLSGGHPPGSTVTAAQVTTILTWITEGSKNN